MESWYFNIRIPTEHPIPMHNGVGLHKRAEIHDSVGIQK